MSNEFDLQSIKYTTKNNQTTFQVLDQLLVPHALVYRTIETVSDAVDAIKTMQVRGAPLIAIVGCLGIATELQNNVPKIEDKQQLLVYIAESVQNLIDARPTAVNMRKEGHCLIEFVEKKSQQEDDIASLKKLIICWVEDLLKVDLETNKAIGKFGAASILQQQSTNNNKKVNILTHCNTGSLATAGYGTALGVVRAIHADGALNICYCTETRPYNQGSRLTAFELLHDKIPSTLLCDSAVSWLMKKQEIAAVVVGADRVVRNGDTANKIGTYQLALTAKAHGIPFYIAAPFSSIDSTLSSGDKIEIEERPGIEVTQIAGTRIAPEGVSVWNPAFDVTPAKFITGIITEIGVFTPEQLKDRFDQETKTGL